MKLTMTATIIVLPMPSMKVKKGLRTSECIDLQDGFTYERAAIEDWFAAHDTSPMTNEPIASTDLQVNFIVKQMVRALNIKT